jgi:hypothetical protein
MARRKPVTSRAMTIEEKKRQVRETMDIELELPCRTFVIDEDGNRGEEFIFCARTRVYIDRRDPDGTVRVVDGLTDWAGRDEVVLRPLDPATAIHPDRASTSPTTRTGDPSATKQKEKW